MPYAADWKGIERWRVKWVDTAIITGGEVKVNDILSFEGSGVKTDPTSILKFRRLGVTTTWGTKCNHVTGPPETVILEHASLGTCHFKRSSGPPLELKGYKGPPTGAVWTAEEYHP